MNGYNFSARSNLVQIVKHYASTTLRSVSGIRLG